MTRADRIWIAAVALLIAVVFGALILRTARGVG